MSQINRDLLADLARLARRYPPEDWESILEWLQDDTRRAQIVTLLRELSVASKQLPSKAKRGRKPLPIAHLFEQMRDKEPAKADLLEDFWRKLRNRELLPTSSSLRMFAETAGLKSLNLRKREQAVNELVRELVELPFKDIQSALEKTSMTPRDLGGEYERWVALILGRSTTR